MNVGYLIAELDLMTKKFDTKIKSVEKQLTKVGKSMENIGKKMSLAVTLPIMAAGAMAFKAASDMEESLNKTTVAFGESSDAVVRWSETTLEAFGLAQESALDLASLYGDMATSMGLPQQAAADMSMSLTGLAADLSSFKNISVEQAGAALKGIFTGETESLKNLGVVMTQAQLEAFALANGYGKLMSQMTQAEKVQLRYAFVMDATKNAQGDFARTSDGAANQMRIFTESIKEVGASFGAILLPIFTPIIAKVNELMKKFGAMDEASKKIVVVIGLVVAAAGPFIMVLGSFLQKLPLVVSGFQKFIGVMGKLQKAMISNPYIAIAAAITAIAIALVLWYKRAHQVSSAQEKMNESIKDAQVQIKLEQKSMNDMFEELKKTNEGSAERADLIKKMNDQYGQYLPKLLTEKSSLDDIAEAQRSANDELAKSILIKAKAGAIDEALTEVYKKQVEAQEKATKAMTKGGMTAESAQKVTAEFIKLIGQGYSKTKAFGVAVQNIFGGGQASLTSSGVDAEFTKLFDLLAEGDAIIATVSQGYDALINSFGTTATVGGVVDGGGGGGTASVSPTVLSSYEQLNKEISEIQDKIKILATDMQTGNLASDFDYSGEMSKLYQELEKLEDIKKQVDFNMLESGDRLLDGVKSNYLTMVDERKKAGMTELQILDEQQRIQLSNLETSLMYMETAYAGNEEKVLAIQKYYAGLKEKILQEYASTKERIENESLQSTKAKLKAEVDAIDASLKTEEEKTQETWENRVSTIDAAVEAGVITMQEGNKLIMKATEDMDKALLKNGESVKTWSDGWSSAVEQIGQIMEDMTVSIVTQFAEGMSQLNNSTSVGLGILGTFMDALIAIGKVLIKAGIAAFAIGTAFQEALKNPAGALLAVGAGIALVALAGATKASLQNAQGLATGGTVTQGGIFKVGENGEELVNLPTGSAVTPNHMLNPMEGLVLTTNVSGRNLQIVLQRADAQSKRR